MFTTFTQYVIYIGVIQLLSIAPGSSYETIYEEQLKATPVYEKCREAVIDRSNELIIEYFNNGSPVIRKIACVEELEGSI